MASVRMVHPLGCSPLALSNMKTLNNVIESSEVEAMVPKGPDFMRIWDGFVGTFDGERIMWFDVDESQSYNFECLSPEIKAILIELTKNWEHKHHFGVYLDW